MRKFLRQLTARSKAVSAHHCTWANKPGYPLITPVSKTCQVPGGGVVLTASLHLLQRHALCLSPVLTSIKAHPQSLDVTKVLQHVLKAKRFHPGGAPGWEWNPNKYFFLFWVGGGEDDFDVWKCLRQGVQENIISLEKWSAWGISFLIQLFLKLRFKPTASKAFPIFSAKIHTFVFLIQYHIMVSWGFPICSDIIVFRFH